MAEKRPNILVLMSDQHSKRQLGCYGDPLVRTPNLDRLASEGMQFSNAYCPSPVCVPSRMSFMTGRTPTSNRVWTNQAVLNSGIPTWAHTLTNAGYETALVGRMHFVGLRRQEECQSQRHAYSLTMIDLFRLTQLQANRRGLFSARSKNRRKAPGLHFRFNRISSVWPRKRSSPDLNYVL